MKSPRRPSKGAHQVTNEAQWIDNDDRSLLERGKINVVSGWEVNSEQRDSGHEPGSFAFGEAIQQEHGRGAGGDLA